MKNFFATRRQRENGYLTAFIAVLLVLLVFVNLIINILATRYEWYFYTGEQYEHTAGGAAEALFSEVSTPVTILFCDEEEELLSNALTALVYNTALQLQEKLDFLTVETVNIYLQPSRVKPYRTATDAAGNTTEIPITTNSVIFVSESSHLVQSMKDDPFFNDSANPSAYNGEELMLSSIGRVIRAASPKAAYTATHGENFSDLRELYTLLYGTGYDITTVNLKEDIPADISLIVIANPLYDFDRAAEGSYLVSELDRLERFVAEGGTLLVSLDPYGKGDLTKLREFLAEYGLAATDEIIKDRENSITYDEFTLITELAAEGGGEAIGERVSAFTDQPAITRESSRIVFSSAADYRPEAILTSSPTARLFREGQEVDNTGSYPVLARSVYTGEGEGGSIILSSGAYFMANDALLSSSYANRTVLFALLEEAGAPAAPLGTSILSINSILLEGLTMKAARLYTVLLAVVLPLLVAAVGILVLSRRKFR